jgi:diguanylate cyclase (GGDEF)-like protein
VAAVTGLRPRIAVPSLVLATAPTIIVIALRPGIEYLASAISLGALLVGGLRSLDRRYRNEVAMATMRQTFVRLARRDHLTGLNNRLGLVEALVGLRAQHGARRRIAVHYLDLDGFKPVNDQLGHQAGDVLLCLVAERLRTAAAPNHIVARLGGDEFAFVQTDAASNTDIAAQALHIEAVLGLPFRVGDRPVVVGTSVGSSQLADADIDIEELLYEADIALRARKIERKARAERYWAEERDPLIGAM